MKRYLLRAHCALALCLVALTYPIGASAGWLSFQGALDPQDANDVVLFHFSTASTVTLHAQTWGYGGTGNAVGGANAAGVVIDAGGFDPYLSLFAGSGGEAVFVASNDDGDCPPGRASPACHDATLRSAALAPGDYILALSVFSNFSLAENLGAGTLGDGFIGLGSYYDEASDLVRSADYAVDLYLVPVPGTLLLSLPMLVGVCVPRLRSRKRPMRCQPDSTSKEVS